MRYPTILALVLLGACRKDDQEAAASCVDDAQAVAMEEGTPLGFVGQDLVDLATGDFVHPLDWADGGVTTLTMSFVPTGLAWFVTSSPAQSDGGEEPAIEPICVDRVEAGATWSFATDDGAFAESWDVHLSATEATAVHADQEIALDALSGDFDILPFISEPAWDEVRAWASAVITAPGLSHGAVSGQVSGEDDCDGDTCTAWASQVAVAAWGTDDTDF